MKQNKTMIVGVTGGVGSGKSTVLDILQQNFNVLIVKADDIGNEVKLKGNSCYNSLISLFGKEILDINGQIDKAKMASLIFADKDLLTKVNGIIHPAVREEIEKIISLNSSQYDYIVIEAALLCEANYLPLLNALIEVRCDKEIRIKRLMADRGYSLEKCLGIINNQSKDSFYKEASDNYLYSCDRKDYYGYYAVENNSEKVSLLNQIVLIMEELDEQRG